MRVLILLLLLLQPAFGQVSDPATGRELAGLELPGLELKVATWNLNWLTLRPQGDAALPGDVRGGDGKDWGRLRAYARALDADVVALQEVDGPAAARRLFPDEQLFFTRDRVVQRVGFAVRAGLRVTQNDDLTGLVLFPDAPHRLRSGADVTLDWPGGRLRLLAVHLKTGCWRDNLGSARKPACAQLRTQVAVLQGWVAQRLREGVPFVLLGDFNREMEQRGDAAWAALSAAAPLVRVDAGWGNPCWGGEGFIDHIIAGGAARGWLQPQTLRVMVYREQGGGWKDRLSDHCAVSARFSLPP